MKINKQQLKQLIMEEMSAMLSEQEYEWPSWDPRQPGGAKPSPFEKSMTPRDQEDFQTIKTHVRSPDVDFLMRKDIESRPDFVGPPSTLPQQQKRIRAGQEAAFQAETSALEKSLGGRIGGDPFDRSKIERPAFERGGGLEMDMPDFNRDDAFHPTFAQHRVMGTQQDVSRPGNIMVPGEIRNLPMWDPETQPMSYPSVIDLAVDRVLSKLAAPNRDDVAYQRDPVPWVTNLTPKERDTTLDYLKAMAGMRAGVNRPEFEQAVEDWYFSEVDPLVMQGPGAMKAGAEAMGGPPPQTKVPWRSPEMFFPDREPKPLEEGCKKKGKKLTITIGKKRKP